MHFLKADTEGDFNFLEKNEVFNVIYTHDK